LFMKKKRELGIEDGTVDSEYQIGILDFGLVYKIDEEFKHKFAELFIDVYVKPAKEIAANILEIGILEPIESIHNLPEKHRTNIIEMVAGMIDDVFHKTGKGDQLKIFEILIQLNEYFNKHNLTEYDIHISKNFLKIQMIMAMSQGIGIMLCKEKHIAMINQVTREIFHLDLIE